MEEFTLESPDDIINLLTEEQKMKIYNEIKIKVTRENAKRYYDNNKAKVKEERRVRYASQVEPVSETTKTGRPRKYVQKVVVPDNIF